MTNDADIEPVIEAAGLTKRYGDRTVVDSLDLTIRRGEIFGLLGPNGAGKTTTILMLLGLTERSAGQVRVCGVDPHFDALTVKSKVGYMPDDVGFYDLMTGRENLRYTARLNRIPPSDAEQRITQALTDVGLSEAADRRTGGYSRGMRQRLGLADTLIKNPEILVLDEPTVNIDPAGVHELLGLIRRLADERGITILLSSHLLHQVEAICDRVGIFIAGRLVACDTVAELVASIDSPWTIEIEAAATDDAIANALTGLDATRLGNGRWTIKADTDPRDTIVTSFTQRRLPLRHLARRTADLDAVYRRYFEESA